MNHILDKALFGVLFVGPCFSSKTSLIKIFLLKKEVRRRFKNNVFIISGDEASLDQYKKFFANKVDNFNNIKEHCLIINDTNNLESLIITVFNVAYRNKRKAVPKSLKIPILIVFDDIAGTDITTNTKKSKQYFTTLRHHNISYLLTANTYSDAPVRARENATAVVFCNPSERSISNIAENFSSATLNASKLRDIIINKINYDDPNGDYIECPIVFRYLIKSKDVVPTNVATIKAPIRAILNTIYKL